MSSAVLSTSAALGRPFLFDDEAEPEVCSGPGHSIGLRTSSKTAGFPHIPVMPASRLGIRPAPEMVPTGIPALDGLTGGLPRGCLTEICGSASSGRSTVLLAALAAGTRRGEFCALIDASNALDPQSAAAAEIELERLLWVRCGEDSSTLRAKQRHTEHCLEQVLRATDLLLESGGFGLIVLDLADLPPQSARRIPLTTWFRFRRAVENKPTILLVIEQQPIAGSCSSLLLQLQAPKRRNSRGRSAVEGESMPPAHAQLLTELEIDAELTRSRFDRKPARSVTFAARTAWAG